MMLLQVAGGVFACSLHRSVATGESGAAPPLLQCTSQPKLSACRQAAYHFQGSSNSSNAAVCCLQERSVHQTPAFCSVQLVVRKRCGFESSLTHSQLVMLMLHD
jgi:hypothetical protein